MILDMDISYGKGVLDINTIKDSIILLRLFLAAIVHATSFLIMHVVRLPPVRHRPDRILWLHERRQTYRCKIANRVLL